VVKKANIKYKNLTSFIKRVRPMTPIKPQIIVASIMSLGYNKNVSYPKPITLAKRNLLFFIGIIGLTRLIIIDKPEKNHYSS